MTGVYGLSFEIVLVNSVFAAAFLAPKERRKWLLVAACAAAVILQAGQWLAPPALAADHTAILVQPNIPDPGRRAMDEGIFSEHVAGLDGGEFASSRSNGKQDARHTI